MAEETSSDPDTPVPDLNKAIAAFCADPEGAMRKAAFDPGCNKRLPTTVWQRGIVDDCRVITFGEMTTMFASISAKAIRSATAVCSLSSEGCTTPRFLGAELVESECKNRQWDLTIKFYFECVKP